MNAKTKAKCMRAMVYAGAIFTMFVLLVLVGYVLVKGIPNL